MSYLDNLRPFEKRLVVGIVAVLFVVLNFLFVFPHFSDWGRTQNRLADAQWTLDKFLKEVAQIPAYTNQINRIVGDQDVPPEDQLAEFSHTINVQAGQSQISILNLTKMTTSTNRPFFLELSQTLSVQSPEERLVDFLYNLGADKSQIRVRGLTVKPDLPRQQLGASVTLVASYQKSTPAPAAAKSNPRGRGQTATPSGTGGTSSRTP